MRNPRMPLEHNRAHGGDCNGIHEPRLQPGQDVGQRERYGGHANALRQTRTHHVVLRHPDFLLL